MKYRISYSFLEPERFTGVKSLKIKDAKVMIGGRDGKIYVHDDLANPLRVHSDWVNDLIFVNNACILFFDKVIVVSCSSDLTVKVTVGTETNQVGYHNDSVTALSLLNDHQVASSGLDKNIRSWDLNACSMTCIFDELIIAEIVLPSSVYAISSTHSMIGAATSLGNAVKLYDIRSNELALELSGHTDMIRTLQMSWDGKHLISGGSDCIVNYWDFAMPNRPVQSITHYNDSIWKIVSKDTNLKTFWVGTKSGYLWKTWRNSSLQSQSVCMGQEASGITALDGVSGDVVWTGSFDLSSWTDLSDTIFPISFNAPGQVPNIPLTSVNMDPDVDSESTLLGSNVTCGNIKLPLYQHPEIQIKGAIRIIKAEILNNKRWVLAENSKHDLILVDIIACSIIKTFEAQPKFDDIFAQINTKEWISNWCNLEIKTGTLTIHIFDNNCYDAEAYLDDLTVSNINEENVNSRVNLALWILTYLFLGYIKSEKESNPILPVLNDSPHNQIAYMAYTAPSGSSYGSPSLSSTHPFSSTSSHSNSISYESFSFINTKDSPWLILPSLVTLRIGIQESAQCSGYLDIFRTTPSALLEDQTSNYALKKIIPEFLSGWLLYNTTPEREVSKINFTLDPIPHSKINPLPGGNNRLNCTKMTRVSKLCDYIDGRIPKEPGLQTRIYLNNELLSPKLTIATVKYFCFKNNGPLVLHYKRVKQESD